MSFDAWSRCSRSLVLLVAAVADPSSSAVDLVLGAVPVVAFGLWAYLPNVPLPAVSVAVVVPVVVAQRSGQLEPLMFESSCSPSSSAVGRRRGEQPWCWACSRWPHRWR